MNIKRITIFFIIALLIAGFFIFDLQRYLDFAYIKSIQEDATNYFSLHPIRTIFMFFVLYVAVAGLSIPGVGVLSVLAGAIFGLPLGVAIVLLAATIGATIAFWYSRYIFHSFVQSHFGNKLQAINKGIERDGNFYLFTLRLIPIFPFLIINLVMGLTPMKTTNYFIVSLLGMFPGSIIFVNVGTQLAEIESLKGILTIEIILSFVLLAMFPWVAKLTVAIIKFKKIYKNFTRPKRFDRNLIVIGAGSAGLVSAYIATTINAKVTLIEKNIMGGDCLNTGCVPSKALIRSAKFLSQVNRAEEFGFDQTKMKFDFKNIMARVRSIIKKIEPHDSIERYTQLGVECVQGNATLIDPWTVSINGKKLTSKSTILATGAKPFIPNIPGLNSVHYYTSDTIWELNALPKRMIVLGGGPIGCELAQCFARFGSKVTLIERFNRIMIREDPDISELVAANIRKDGVNLLTNHTASEILKNCNENVLISYIEDKPVETPFDALLVAVGRKAHTNKAWSDSLNLEKSNNGKLRLNDFLQTNYPNIYACGDVAGPYEFTHTAAHQAWYATVNALFAPFKKFRVDYSVIPWCTFTDPEVARVGLNEEDARKKNITYEVTKYNLSDLDRAITDEEAHGIVKVLTLKGKDKVIGAVIVGDHAGELITEFVTAMKHGIGMNKLLNMIHIYPTLSEANKFAAGEWKKAHAPKNILNWMKIFHALRRKL